LSDPNHHADVTLLQQHLSLYISTRYSRATDHRIHLAGHHPLINLIDLQRHDLKFNIRRFLLQPFEYMRQQCHPASEAPTSSFHGVSHHGEDPRRILDLAKINQYHVAMVAHLAESLNGKMEGERTILDNTLILYGSNMGNSNQHVHYDVPHVLIGGAAGKLKGGRHLAYPTKTVPTGNLLLSLLDTFDIHRDSFGDSTGRLEEL
jgi:hypothetical protein